MVSARPGTQGAGGAWDGHRGSAFQAGGPLLADQSCASPATLTIWTSSSRAPTGTFTPPGGRVLRLAGGCQRLRRAGRGRSTDHLRGGEHEAHLDLFVVRSTGHRRDVVGARRAGRAGSRSPGGRAAPGSRVEAVARNPNHLDLFVTGEDGGIGLDLVGCCAPAGRGWFQIHPAVRRAPGRRSRRFARTGTTWTCSSPAMTERIWTRPGGRLRSGWAGWFRVRLRAAHAAWGRPITAHRGATARTTWTCSVTGTDGRIESPGGRSARAGHGWFDTSPGAPRRGDGVDAGRREREPPGLCSSRHGRADMLHLVDAASGWAGGSTARCARSCPRLAHRRGLPLSRPVSICSSTGPTRTSTPPAGTRPKRCACT